MSVPTKYKEIITDNETSVPIASNWASSPHPLGTLEGVLGLVVKVMRGDPKQLVSLLHSIIVGLKGGVCILNDVGVLHGD